LTTKKPKRKIKTSPDSWLTDKELQLLQLLKNFGQVKAVAEEMRITYRRAQRILANIRRKWVLSVNTHNKLVAMTKRDSTLRHFLSQPRRLPSPEIKKTEEEETFEEQH
jgi:molybdenum-dependent DNA-binding transcriptional regulator ModE